MKKSKYIIDYFSKEMPDVKTELQYNDAFQLLCAIILSAQCTDKRVNLITPALFQDFPTVKEMAEAEVQQIFERIKSCSYPNNKSKHLSEMAKMLIAKFNGRVPETREELEKLPGVGRKTANVILSVFFNKSEMPVDTHVFRVSNRLGIVKQAKTPIAVEKQLREFFPEDYLSKAHHWLIMHGRYVCKARKPSCAFCGLRMICKFYKGQS